MCGFGYKKKERKALNSSLYSLTHRNARTIKLVSLRVRHIDTDFFVDAIRKYGADICGLNEVRGEGPLDGYTDQTNAIGDGLGFNRYFAQAIMVDGTSPYGNAMVSRFPITYAETVAIPGPVFKRPNVKYESRCVLKAVVDAGGQEISVLICHMGLSEEERKCAVKQVCKLLDEIEMPVILMGDFNTTPDDTVLKPIYERMNDTDTLAAEKGMKTYPSYDPDIKIDYIFYRKIECKSVKTITEVYSDHFPIIAEFE